MNLQTKILPVALVAALLGGTVGALVMRPKPVDANTATTSNLLPASSQTTDAASLRDNETFPATNNETQATLDAANASGDPEAYRAGFNDGFETARDNKAATASNVSNGTRTNEPVVYRNAPARTRTVRNSAGSRQAYYDYAPQKRSFWSKHRDKLTVAMGTGGGALLGGLIGGKKGAAIGALGGGGGSALYTYKIRKHNRR